MHVIAAKAVALKEAASPSYQEYARQVIANAQALVAGLQDEGMRPVSGGTDTHLAFIDLRGVDVTGRDAELRCDAAKITLNKNAIPFDPAKPMIASGVRVGTPSVTTQGMGQVDMKEVASLIGRAVRADVETDSGQSEIAQIGDSVSALVSKYPAYPDPSPNLYLLLLRGRQTQVADRS